MRLPCGFRLRRPCHSELVELLRQAAKARGERRRGISGGFAQDDSVGRREDNILPYKLEVNKIKFGGAPITNTGTPPIKF